LKFVGNVFEEKGFSICSPCRYTKGRNIYLNVKLVDEKVVFGEFGVVDNEIFSEVIK
jgi:hypothetical protein